MHVGRGGPILAVQVENEYGSFGSDHEYVGIIRQASIDAGFGESLMYTADPPAAIMNGSLPDLLAAANFGMGDARAAWALLDRLRPHAPHMIGEYWAGWYDSLGRALCHDRYCEARERA